MGFKFINPTALCTPRGYSHGVLSAPGGSLLFIAGQVGCDNRQRIVSTDFVEQFDRALENLITVVTEAGGTAQQIARLVIYVTNTREYEDRTAEIGERYRARMGKHFPAMVLAEVKSLLENDAKVEIEGVAVL